MSSRISQKVYWRVFFVLVLLTLLTVGITFIELGGVGRFIPLAIAATKALLVVLFFMHVYYSSPVIWIFSFAGIFWVAILLLFVVSDYLTR